MANQTTKRTDMFQHLVLSLLWVILLAILKCDFAAKRLAMNSVSGLRAFGDTYGTQGEDAKKYRRENTYWIPENGFK